MSATDCWPSRYHPRPDRRRRLLSRGSSQPEPELFKNIVWSSPFTFEHTVRNIKQLGLQLVALEQWYDVDTFADLRSLNNELRLDEQARKRAPATFGWLLAHDLSFSE
jgi:hypothetical protein